jgi:glycosyltransferase involved in cell wall biosynthesis
MNVHSNIVFANQSNRTEFCVKEFDGHTAKMITTATRGVGNNRNIALIYANADICLFADDDVCYVDDLEEIVIKEFQEHPDADAFVFNLDSDDGTRKQKKYTKTRKCHLLERMPWGAVRIAVRLESLKKKNAWFSELFGGGCIFASGEDSLWLTEARKKKMRFYVSKETIGKVSFETSTWFTGLDEKFFFSKGAFYQAAHSKTVYLWMIYFVLRTSQKACSVNIKEKWMWMRLGQKGYKEMKGYEFYSSLKNNV